MRKLKGDVVLAVLAVMVIGVLAAVRSSGQHVSVPSTHDYGPSGLSALYALLQREHLPVARSEEPQSKLFARKGAIVVAGEMAILQSSLDKLFWNGMRDWVHAGGTLVLAGGAPAFNDGLALPKSMTREYPAAHAACAMRGGTPFSVSGPFERSLPLHACTKTSGVLLQAGSRALAVAYRSGKGTVIYVADTSLFSNSALGSADNAAFAYALFAPLGPIVFDESLYGFGATKSAWSVLPLSVRFAVVIIALAGALAIIGANLPFAPARILESNDVRDSSEYLAALAAMLERSCARRDAVARLCNEVRRMLAPYQADGAARSLLEQARTIDMQNALHDDDLIAASHLYTTAREDYL